MIFFARVFCHGNRNDSAKSVWIYHLDILIWKILAQNPTQSEIFSVVIFKI